MTALNDLAQASYDGSTTYGERIHIVHVNVIEPHPSAPDVSPYRGGISEVTYSIPQPRTFDARAQIAAQMEMMLRGEQLLLVDDLATSGRTNPIWCSYGPAPNSAYLIDRTGLLRRADVWFHPSEMKGTIDTLLAE